MFFKMFRFEWRYFTRQPSFIVTSAIFFLLTFFATVSENIQIGGGGNVLYNGPYSIGQTLLIMGLFAMFLTVNFVANTAIRNDQFKMSEILYSKPINPLSYQLGRFFGSFAVVCTVFAFVPLGILIGCSLGELAGWVDPERLGPTQLGYYLSAFFYLSVPTLFVLSSLFYAMAIRFRSMMPVYLSAVGLFIGYNVAGQFFNEPEYRTMAALLDPFGLNAFGEVTRYWTMYDKNNADIDISGVLLQNRLLWLVSAAAILLLFGRVGKNLVVGSDKPAKKKQADDTAGIAQALEKRIDISGSNKINTLAHLKQRIGFEIKQVIFSAPFLVLGALTVFMLVAPLLDPNGMFGTPDWPLTQLMVQLIQNSTSLLMMIILAYYSAEVVWRERSSGMGDIIDSMPVHNLTFWLSKVVAIGLVFVLLMVFASVVTLSNQTINGYQHFELGQYLFRLGYLLLVPLMMAVILAFFLQVLSPNKYVGMLLFMLYVISIQVLSNFGFSHPIFQFAEAPRIQYSDINQYGHFLTAFNWFTLYWLGATLVLAALSYALWHRGPAQPLKERLKSVGYYLGSPGKTVVALGAVIFVATGAFIYHNTYVLNDYIESDPQEALQAKYEKKYVEFKESDIPTITKVFAKVDIYPSERRLIASADIDVVNKNDKPINRFLVTEPGHSPKWDVMIEGGKLVEFDDELNAAWFEFESPLEPGEMRSGTLSVERSHQGFRAGGEDLLLVENGTFINNYQLFPAFGYNGGVELTDRHTRRKYGLEPLQRAHKLEETSHYDENSFGNGIAFIDFEAVISTDEDQFAIAPGYLQSETVENGRRTFHYKMDAPMANFYSVLSASLEAKKVNHKGISIEVYYHKTHDMNVDRMIESVKDSIDYFSENFGPYQHRQLRIIEFPGYRTFAQSFANTVPYSEKIGFISDVRDPEHIDPAYYVTAHEVAHQWWGHQVGAANVQGSEIISETLSQYSALMVMEHKYGKEKIRKFLKYELDNYLRGRTTEIIEEMPLMRAENQQYIHYRKGSVVMMALRDRLGEERVNRALHDFLTKFKYQSAPYPTTLDLLGFLKQEASEGEQRFIDDQFAHITLYELALKDVEVAEQPDGEGLYSVSLTIDAKQKRADGKGEETEVSLDEWVDIGLFSADPEDLSADDFVLYLEKHHIVSGENTLKLKVKEKPSFAGVDPFVKLVDKDSADNIKRL